LIKGKNNERNFNDHGFFWGMGPVAGIYPAKTGHFNLTEKFLSGDKP